MSVPGIDRAIQMQGTVSNRFLQIFLMVQSVRINPCMISLKKFNPYLSIFATVIFPNFQTCNFMLGVISSR